MMHLPPQAYTKETLIQAYNWLRSQPPHVQELAKSPDALVALFSKAQMHGENYLSRTNLSGFKSELKNLANMMGEFDESQNEISPKAPSGGPKVNSAKSAAAQSQPLMGNSSVQNGAGVASPLVNPAITNPTFNSMGTGLVPNSTSGVMPSGAQANAIVNSVKNNGTNAVFNTLSANIGGVGGDPTLPLLNSLGQLAPGVELRSVLDARSWSMLQEVKVHFNLSSEVEAMRLLVAIGYQKVRSQY